MGLLLVCSISLCRVFFFGGGVVAGCFVIEGGPFFLSFSFFFVCFLRILFFGVILNFACLFNLFVLFDVLFVCLFCFVFIFIFIFI